MKTKIAIALFLVPLLVQAATISILSEYIPAAGDYRVDINDSDGTTRTIRIGSNEWAASKVDAIADESSFSLPSKAFRYITYFNPNGSQNYIDCATRNPFASKQVYSYSSTATNNISTFKSYVEAH